MLFGLRIGVGQGSVGGWIGGDETKAATDRRVCMHDPASASRSRTGACLTIDDATSSGFMGSLRRRLVRRAALASGVSSCPPSCSHRSLPRLPRQHLPLHPARGVVPMSETERCAQPVAHGPPKPPPPTRDSRVGFLVKSALERAQQQARAAVGWWGLGIGGDVCGVGVGVCGVPGCWARLWVDDRDA